MFGSYFQKQSKLDEPIDAVLNSMRELGPDAPEYSDLIAHLERLESMKRENRIHWPSSDTMAVVGGNLVGILIMVAYERTNVLTSKALGQLLRTQTNK